MKKWSNAEFVTLDISLTASGNNKNRHEGNESEPGNSEKNGKPNQNNNPTEIIDDFFSKSDTNATS